MTTAVGLITANYAVKDNGKFIKGTRPAAATPFLGRYRMVDFALSNMVNAGIDTIGLIMPDKYRSIIDHVGAGKDWGLDRKNGGLFPLPGSSFGTTRVGPRFLLRDIIDNRAYLHKSKSDITIMSSSNFAHTCDYKDLMAAHTESGADVTLVTFRLLDDDENVTAILKDDDGAFAGVKAGAKAGDTAFMDLAVVNTAKLEELLDWYENADHLDLLEALAGDANRVKVNMYASSSFVRPIFSQAAFYKYSMELLDPEVADQLFPADMPVLTKSHDTTPAKYEPGAHVANSLISSGTEIYGTVKNSIVGRAVQIEEGATVTNSIIIQNTTVKSGARIENAIIDRNNDIPSGTELRGTPDDIFVLPKGND